MIFDPHTSLKIDHVFKYFKFMKESIRLEKGVLKCDDCENGLKANEGDGGYSWSHEYCDNCKGIGYIAPDLNLDEGYIDGEMFVCKNCKGIGCKECKTEGIVDWITHLKGI